MAVRDPRDFGWHQNREEYLREHWLETAIGLALWLVVLALPVLGLVYVFKRLFL